VSITGVKPCYWLRSARATEHFPSSGLVETDRLTELAEKTREGTNCIISTKAVSTVDAVDIDIDAHQDAHWWLPLFLTYSNSKVSRSLTELCNRPFSLSETSPQKIIVQRHSPTLVLGVGLHCSEHLIMAPTSSVAAWTVVFTSSLERWHRDSYNLHSHNQWHKEHPVQPSGQPGRSQRSRLGESGAQPLASPWMREGTTNDTTV
jgi:hypothetical protein